MMCTVGLAGIPGDWWIALPAAGLLESLILDISIRDVAFWFPRLNWSELGAAIAVFFCLKFACDWLEGKMLALLKPAIAVSVEFMFPGLAGRLRGWISR